MKKSSRFKLLIKLKEESSFSSSRYLGEVNITDSRITISRRRLGIRIP